MSTPIEIQGMTLSIDWYRDSNDNLIVRSVSNIGNSWEFLVDNIDHPALEKVQYRELGNEDYINEAETAHNFYQLSHYDQCDLICEMLNYDDSLHHHFADKCYEDKDGHYALKEDCFG